jgi:hypothetical protein
MNRTCVIASPFGCTWIQHGSEGHVDGTGYAVCVRVAHSLRVVSEMDCAHCGLWEAPATSHDESSGEVTPFPSRRGDLKLQR